MERVHQGQVGEITFIDGDQEIQATLDDDVEPRGQGADPLHPGPAGDRSSPRSTSRSTAGTIEKSNSENPQPSLLGSILATLLPFVLIVLLFLFLMNQVQGGGGRASCSSPSPRPS